MEEQKATILKTLIIILSHGKDGMGIDGHCYAASMSFGCDLDLFHTAKEIAIGCKLIEYTGNYTFSNTDKGNKALHDVTKGMNLYN